ERTSSMAAVATAAMDQKRFLPLQAKKISENQKDTAGRKTSQAQKKAMTSALHHAIMKHRISSQDTTSSTTDYCHCMPPTARVHCGEPMRCGGRWASSHRGRSLPRLLLQGSGTSPAFPCPLLKSEPNKSRPWTIPSNVPSTISR